MRPGSLIASKGKVRLLLPAIRPDIVDRAIYTGSAATQPALRRVLSVHRHTCTQCSDGRRIFATRDGVAVSRPVWNVTFHREVI